MNNGRKILVIDDEAHIRRVIQLKLEKRGYEVIMASNGEEGLYLIKSKKPDVVVTDIMMPRLDGKSLCEYANDFKKKWSFLTIIMTCRISPDEQKWIYGLTDAVFMEKPFSPSKLVEAIDEYFKTGE